MIEIMSENLINLLISKTVKQRRLDKGACLFHQGDQVSTVFVVGEGLVELTRHQQDGAPLVLQRAIRKTILAEASAYSETYHCDAIAQMPSVVYELPKTVFLKRLGEDETLAYLWAAHLAREVQSARYRSEILTRKTVAERLSGWLAWKGNKLPLKGQWKSMAVQIGVSPEALYRELAKRRFRGC